MAAKKKSTTKKAARKATSKKATTSAKKATAKKATAKKATAKKATTSAKKATTSAKKATAKKAATSAKATAKKATAKKTTAKKATAKKATAKKATAKKATAKKTPAKAAARKTAPAHPPLTPKKSMDLSALAGSYRDGDAMAHPVTAEQMEQVRRDGLRGDETIRHVEDDADVAPCRLVDHGEGRYSLCLDDFRMPKVALFDERGLQGGGYTWEAIADSLARLRRPELVDGLSYDSEAGMFVALGTRPTLVALAHLLQEAMDDEGLLTAAVDAADPDRLE